MQNHIDLVGRLTKPIRINNINGRDVVNFTAAVDFEMKGTKATIAGVETIAFVPATSYLDCSAWGREAEAARSLEKGQEVTFHIDSLVPKLSIDKDGNVVVGENGKPFVNLAVSVSDVRPGIKSQKASTNGNGHSAAAETLDPLDDEIPF